MGDKPYAEWSLEALKQELRRRNAKLAGRKKDLVARLLFLDINQPRHAATATDEQTFSMALPESETYKDLHQGMQDIIPTVSQTRLDEYLSLFDKAMDSKVEDFYKERYLRYIRASFTNSETFISSCVWAEMRKSASYRVDVSLDKNGVVMEAQCECGAGQGPSAHCKHVCAVVFALVNFCKTSEVITELTCTQVLQTFHKAKPHKGSPLKVEELQDVRGRGQKQLIFDPRPVHLRNRPGSMDNFRNACINFALPAGHPMPVMQLFQSANIPALAHDHDYLLLTPEDQFLKHCMVTAISEEDACNVEAKTRGQGNNKLWKEVRMQHITSSNFGVICKATDRKDMEKLTQSLMSPSDIRCPAVLHGRKYESVAIEALEKKLGLKTEECGIFICQNYPPLAASPDRIVDKETCVEVKCPFSSKDKAISARTVPYLKQVNGQLTLDTNHDYFYQIQGQLLCSARKYCLFVVYTLVDICVLKIERDDLFIDQMVEKLMIYFKTHFRSAFLEKFFFRKYYQYSF